MIYHPLASILVSREKQPRDTVVSAYSVVHTCISKLLILSKLHQYFSRFSKSSLASIFSSKYLVIQVVKVYCYLERSIK